MAAFVTPQEYLAYYDLDDDAYRVGLDLEAACDKVRDYVCQTLTAVANDVVTIQGTGTRALLLPELPVTGVDSITLDGDPVTDFTFDAYGLLWKDYPTDGTSSTWVKGYQYVVTYDHGYTDANMPGLFKVIAIQLARRAESSGLRQESLADYSATYVANAEDGLLAALDRRVVKKVPTP